MTVLTLTAVQWLVLDNLSKGWAYHTNVSRDLADEAYLWCVRNEYIRHGLITDAGRGALAAAKVGGAAVS